MRFLLLGLGALLATSALAEPVNFAIPAGPADRALLTFSRQAGMEVLFPYTALQRVRSTKVTGYYERDQALQILLQGTSFVARPNGRGAFVITAAPAQAAAKRAPGRAPPAEAVDETTRLAPYLVRGLTEATTGPLNSMEVPTGNLDLPRTENDALPYEIYSRQRISVSGAVTLDDFLSQVVLESTAGPSLAEGGSNSTATVAGFLGGSTNLNLRAYGQDETLVLVNGLPLPQLLSGGLTNGSSQSTREADVNLIPLPLVDHIEILPVSAAALYSGNPVGGVINIVLRPIENLDELTTTYSNGFKVSAPQSMFSLLHSQTLLQGKLSFRLNATFSRSIPATEGELGYIGSNLAAHPDLNLPPGYPPQLYRATPNVASDAGTPLFGPGTSNLTSVPPGASGAGGLAAFNGRQGVSSLGLFQVPNGFANSPESGEDAYGRKQWTSSYFLSAVYDPSSHVRFGVNGLYAHTVTNPGYDIFQGNLQLPANSPYNPFNQTVDVTLNETAPLLGAGYDEANIDEYYAVAALLLKLPGAWQLNADADYNRTTTRYRGLAGVDNVQWQNLVDAGLYNPLRDTEVSGPPASFYNNALVYFGGPGRFVTLDDYRSLDSAVRLSNNSLTLPTGDAAVSGGVDYRIDHTANFNDDQYYGDGALSPTSGEWLGRTLQQLSTFAEVQAPLLPARLLPGWIRQVRFDIAARYNESNAGLGTNVSPSFGLKIDLPRGFALRGSLAKTNRFPTPFLSRFVPTLGGSGTGAVGEPGQELIKDPARGGESYDVATSEAPVTNLFPEADVTSSIGIIFQTGMERRFRMSVDFFNTRKSGELQPLDAQDDVDYEAFLPGRVTRGPPAPGDPFGVGPVIAAITGAINVASLQSQNWNTSLDYSWTECHGGTLQIYARWVYFQRYIQQLLAATPPVDELNSPDTSGLGLLRNRVNFGAGWSNHRLGFGLEGQYFAPRVLPQLLWADQGGRAVDAYCPFAAYLNGDLARWLPWLPPRLAMIAQLRVDNVLGSPLPKFPDNPSGIGVDPYGDWRGRVFSLSLTVSY